jgi:hypothetical protein
MTALDRCLPKLEQDSNRRTEETREMLQTLKTNGTTNQKTSIPINTGIAEAMSRNVTKAVR